MNADEDDSNKINSRETYSTSDNNISTCENIDRNTAVSLLIAAADNEDPGTGIDGFDNFDATTDFEYSFFNYCFMNNASDHPDTETVQSLEHLNDKIPYLNSNWILLDNQSTVRIFRTHDLVTDIHS